MERIGQPRESLSPIVRSENNNEDEAQNLGNSYFGVEERARVDEIDMRNGRAPWLGKFLTEGPVIENV